MVGNSGVTALIGGSPAGVVLRLIVVSFVVGLLLAMFGFDPENIYTVVLQTLRRTFDFGLVDIRRFGTILLTGAMVVVPVWIILRLLSARRPR